MTFYELPLEVQGRCKKMAPGELYALASIYIAEGKFQEGLAIAREASTQLEALLLFKKVSEG